jgi:hypothetical protein
LGLTIMPDPSVLGLTIMFVSGMVARPMHGFAKTTRLNLPNPRA